jgi:steroid 5-alpha reductase family enzyme
MPDAASSRARGFLVCAVVYASALLAAWLVARLMPLSSPLMVAAAADGVATLVVFAWSRAFDNSSLYDPYWSVAPVALMLYFTWAEPEGDDWRKAAVPVLVSIWAVRLTYNWARRWRGLRHEDWRYVDIRQRTGRWYWPVSLLGIHLMPTAAVFLGCLPAHAAVTVPLRNPGPLDLIATLLTVGGIWIEAVADERLFRFSRERQDRAQHLETGLWAWSRHPNYLGEVLFWWGLGLFGMAAAPERWAMLLGPVAITCLFLFISIPMMDRHLGASRPGSAERRRRVSRLIPWFPK